MIAGLIPLAAKVELMGCGLDPRGVTAREDRKVTARGEGGGEPTWRTIDVTHISDVGLRSIGVSMVDTQSHGWMPDGLMFVGDRDGLLRRGNFHRATQLNRDRGHGGAPGGLPLPRSATHREPPGGECRGQHAGADAPDGARVDAGGVDLQHATTVRDQQIAARAE